MSAQLPATWTLHRIGSGLGCVPLKSPSRLVPEVRWRARSGRGEAASLQPGLLSQGGSQVGFQTNERFLQWDDSATRRLIKLHVATELGESVEWVEARMLELCVLLPDCVGKLERMQAPVVVRLCADTAGVAARLIALRSALPGLNVSSCVATIPWLLLDAEPAQLAAQMARLGEVLPEGADVVGLVEREPALLRCNVGGVVADVRRLGVDPGRAILADPCSVLDMGSAGLSSSLEVDKGLPAA